MPATVNTERIEIRSAIETAGLWWLLVLMGVVSVVAGGILVAKPSHSLATLCVIFGIFLLLDGIVAVVISFRHDAGNRALAAILGVLSIIFGIILIRHPTHAVTAIGLLIGLWLVAAGVVRMIYAIMEESARFARIAVAALEIIVGIVVVSDPHIGYATLAVLLGIWLIINGIGLVGLGVILRKARSELVAASSA